MTKRRARPVDLTRGLLLLVGVALSVAASGVLRQNEEATRDALFDALAAGRVSAIERGLDGALARVRGTAIYVAAAPALERGGYATFRPEFRTYAAQLAATAPEMVAIGWVPRVTASERSDFLRQAQPPEGGFDLTELQLDGTRIAAESRPVYYPLTVLAPIEPFPHLGTDLGADAAHAKRLEEALRTGRLMIEPGHEVLRGSVTLHSVAILVPLAFERDAPAAGMYDGFAIGLVEVETLMDQTIGGTPAAGVDAQLRDNVNGRVLYSYRTSTQDPPDQERWIRSYPLAIGDNRWIVDVRAQPEFLEATEPVAPWVVLGSGLLLTFGLVGYVSAVHRKSEAREALAAERRETATHLQSIFDTSFDAIVSADDRGTISEWNASAERMFGWRQDEVLGLTLQDTIIPANQRAGFLEALRGLRETGESDLIGPLIEFRMARRDTSAFPVELAMTPTPVAGEVRITAFIRDITRRKAAEKAMLQARDELEDRVRERTADLEQATGLLKDSAQRLRLMMENAGDAVFLSDEAGKIVDVNLRACAMLGYEPDELLKLTVPDIETRADPAQPVGPRLGALAPGEVITSDGEQRRKDGTTFPVEVRVGPIDSGGRRLYLALARDVTERRAMETALAAARDQALEASRLKSDFLANTSHEIRTPLNGILGMTNLLLESPLTTGQREDLETVRQSAEHLLTLINDVLDLARIEAGQLHVERANFDLEVVLQGVAGLLSAAADRKGIEFILRIAPSTPRGLLGDATRLRQVLVNLAANAVKFTDRGHVLLEAEPVSINDTDSVIRFAVKDTGVGIPEADLTRVFEKFTQVDQSAQRRHGGAGLGLTISRQLAEAMGGEIAARSTPGVGSEFILTLPLPLGEARKRPLRPKVLAGLRTLAVDDNAVNRRVLSEQLIAWRMRENTVETSTEALTALRKASAQGDPYRIALLDFQMEEMNGLDLARAIKQDPMIEPPLVLLLSSVGRHFDDHIVAEAGIARWLSKPVTPSELLDAMTDAWEGTRRRAPERLGEVVGPTQTLRVLVAEDSPVNQQVAMRMLQGLGCVVDLVKNGLEAVKMVETTSYDVIFMDCQMPEMDGYEATRRIRAIDGARAQTPIVALTAHAMAGERDRCLAAGMDDYLSKPVAKPELMAMLRKWSQPSLEAERSVELPGGTARFDADAVVSMVEGDAEVVADLARLFAEHSTTQVSALGAAITAGDLDQVCRLGHALKGSTATLYGMAASALAHEVEEAGRRGDLEAARGVLPRLEEEVLGLQWEMAELVRTLDRERGE